MTADDAIVELLSGAGLGPPSRVDQVQAGTLNRNYRVEASDRVFFAREYRQDLPAARIREEHELLAWCSERGLPVSMPLEQMTGSVMDIGGRLWSLFSWVEGVPVPRGGLSPTRASALGEMHGNVQSVLATHPASAGATWPRRWDKGESLATVSNLLEVARGQAAPQWMVEALTLHREILDAASIRPFEEFAGLPVQLLHGDFHDQQVLFDEAGEVVLVADWELFQTAPRAWELLRSLDFSLALDTDLLAQYLAGYRRHIRLSVEEAELATAWWWQSRLIGAWPWHAYFIEGNSRVVDILPETAAQMRKLARSGWKEHVSERFVDLACR